MTETHKEKIRAAVLELTDLLLEALEGIPSTTSSPDSEKEKQPAPKKKRSAAKKKAAAKPDPQEESDGASDDPEVPEVEDDVDIKAEGTKWAKAMGKAGNDLKAVILEFAPNAKGFGDLTDEQVKQLVAKFRADIAAK